ncbi:hypothetical protein [Cohnella mopanensis]|uniref:hypothetical protein n=1 Tax=Cohnella mopanensis TaxID=2911966 RepID=UPI001EF8B187|nr:hypothetical protein [Cohnella mopanensis]
MAMAMYKIRIISNACITRYNSGEGAVNTIVSSYNMAQDDHDLVLAEIYAKRPDIAATTEGVAA